MENSDLNIVFSTLYTNLALKIFEKLNLINGGEGMNLEELDLKDEIKNLQRPQFFVQDKFAPKLVA